MNESDSALLQRVPDFLSIGSFLKATPAEEMGRRFVYVEASNEQLDQQGEVVLQKALAESAEYFLQFGNLDLDHITQIGAKTGIPDYNLYEIGRPIDVRMTGQSTFVKGEIYSGSGPAAERANQFWDSLTAINPPARWYPSVGGQTLEKAVDVDTSGIRKAYIRKVRWTNLAFSKTPVNPSVSIAQTIPVGAFGKCWGLAGLDIAKALSAGYGTDSAALAGGGALRTQSLHGSVMSYVDFRDQLANQVRTGKPNPAKWVDWAVNTFGFSKHRAAQWVERFLRDLNTMRVKP